MGGEGGKGGGRRGLWVGGLWRAHHSTVMKLQEVGNILRFSINHQSICLSITCVVQTVSGVLSATVHGKLVQHYELELNGKCLGYCLQGQDLSQC